MYEIKITKATQLKAKPTDESQLGFGKIFSDHMLMINYDEGQGWHDARVVPYGNLSLDPACSVLHYGQEIFEGAKCYRTEKGFNLFRIRDNFERMNHSAERMGMAKMPVELYMESLMALLNLDKEWTPHKEGTSLYIRPTMIATDAQLGVSAAKSYLYYVLLSPSGAYYASGLAPVSIYVEDQLVRAVRGGVGFAKTGGNYAASILAGAKAKHEGHAQVLWLDGVEQRYIEEVGSMNMMFVYENKKIVTPALNGSILPGITRDSVLKLAKHMGYEVEEKRMAIDDVIADAKNGKLTEAFGTGTAAVVSPVNKIAYKGTEVKIGDGNIGKITQKLYDTLTGIQFGKLADQFGWITTF
ncbi:MAG TPA: branched-chain amino acid aminotransferase [Candidatus Limiplasma sp.]|nr:branched-chain amino acid aminotransferase [Candidatus Limiplasma sp.]HPS81547.1 branched-chain amino acid aminotransferase [Candidatus Limiplasma sp.]